VPDGRLSWADRVLGTHKFAGTSTAKEVTDVERDYTLNGDVLLSELTMAAVRYPASLRLTSELRVVPT
jgi:hypothetical protein